MLKKTLITLTIITFTLIVNKSINAQSEISPEKQKLIAELVVLTKTDTQMVEITDSILASYEETYPIILEQALRSQGTLSEDELQKLTAQMTTSFQSFNKKFRERLPQKMDYNKFIRESIYPLYDKYFTEQELTDLIAFYKTETGKKVVTTMPKLFADSSKMAEVYLLPVVLQLVDEIIREEIKSLENSRKVNDTD